MTSLAFAAVDDDTYDLLDLLSDDGTLHTEDEWDYFVHCLKSCATTDAGLIKPNTLRPQLREHVKPQRVGAFVHRAVTSGLIAATGDWQTSDDLAGRNSGKPARVYRWVGAA